MLKKCDCLLNTILLEVLLVRSFPCRLGISSDMALSCCLSFANLWEKFEYSKYSVLEKSDNKNHITQISIAGLSEWGVDLHDEKQKDWPTFPEAASEASSCACKGLDGALGSACTSSSQPSGSGRVWAARYTGCWHGPGGTLLKWCTRRFKFRKICHVLKTYCASYCASPNKKPLHMCDL